MDPGNRPKGSVPKYLLAGMETGVIAVLIMLVWLGVSSMWYRKTFWNAANLVASTFYVEPALRNRFTVHTYSGLALSLLIYGALGMLFGLSIQDRRRSLRLTGRGLLVGIECAFVEFGWIG